MTDTTTTTDPPAGNADRVTAIKQRLQELAAMWRQLQASRRRYRKTMLARWRIARAARLKQQGSGVAP